jgi:signal transduction histidine kinase
VYGSRIVQARGANALGGLGALVLASLSALTAVATNPLPIRLLQASFPAVLAVGLLVYGYRHASTLRRERTRPLVAWVLATLLYFAIVGTWFSALSIRFETSIPLAILTSLTAGVALGAVIGVYAVRLNAANDDLSQANEELSAFASIVSHDLRNPVQVAGGSLELLTRDLDDEDPNVERIDHSLTRIDTIIENVLVLTRRTEDGPRVQSVDVGAVALSALETTDAPGTSLHLDDPPVGTDADPDLLATLFENLFRNASDHGPDGVTVTVGSLDDGPGFYVEDDGPGIPADEREDVFEMGESPDGNTGIGLFVVGRVVDVHDWGCAATTGEDGGARFEFRT